MNQMYLRELPEPVFRFPVAERVQHTRDRGAVIFLTSSSFFRNAFGRFGLLRGTNFEWLPASEVQDPTLASSASSNIASGT